MSYDKLWDLLKTKGLLKQDLQAKTGISSGSIAKLSKGANIQTDTLLRICQVLDCQIGDIAEVMPATEVKEQDAWASSDLLS
ncbi:Cro/C1-type HTH DNA-binding domain protein [Propionimicrobium sp. BV2F7]|nr:Cro/C1-type HTH DNA-binding domain protein [Propionimicrobium sp. BV2F7]